ncbi:beta-ACP synthase [Streptomyces ambofaciens]|uniref:Beta-ACP synthase n=1 Tax=Streptomyces ambofaciens TaxID=1889 RepID=Q0JW89_STRAM|nr:beta-ketoacyl-[acyl-carrier-protein] synthase family protein [Streptomyces ambofaciens]ANB04146.1 beta-ACP synthase [Streptomyces ambofaciens]ANB10694.1 beta-ACP synthase [Streptomyces ambofaciens]CAK51040.1 putative polyketide synthase [Streptomyces ambofaciens]CAK51278.1 putative polyketide synthase [Streptomyces ambofaciens]
MKRVVITGIGVVAPGGVGTKSFWDLLTIGRTATRPITLFDASAYRSRIAAEVDFDPAAHGFASADTERLDRITQFALVAAREAIADSGIGESVERAPLRCAVSLGSAIGCTTALATQYAILSDCGNTWDLDHTEATDFLYDYFVPSSLAAALARDCGAQGPVALVSSGCTSGLDAIGHGADLIREGSTDMAVVGGAEAPIAPITMASFDRLRLTSSRNDDPATASRPFDRTRDGFVLGEGAAVLVLEEQEHARRRGAQPYAELSGLAAHSSAHHMTGLRPGAQEMAAAIRAALDQARLNPADIDYISAHGAGTRHNDRHETHAFKAGLGHHAHRVPVSSIKSMIGHALGAAGALDLTAGALAIRHGIVPPTANLHQPDPTCDLDYTPLFAREQRTSTVLSVASGFGGFHTAAVLTRPRLQEAA